MFSGLKRLWNRIHAGVRSREVGSVRCDSSVLLLADPTSMYDPVRVEGIPPGRYPIIATLIRYPEGGEHVAGIAIRFRPGDADERRPLGEIGVDSAMIVAVDESTYQNHWQEVGPERVGRTSIPRHHRRVAELISREFGLTWREVNPLSSVFLEPISEELEARIQDFLKAIPEYADCSYMYFSVTTGNTRDRLWELRREGLWGELILDAASDAALFTVKSGFGDGRYVVEGLYHGSEILAVEVAFIGPAQDAILEAFPQLRH